jgi:hypothetical protein
MRRLQDHSRNATSQRRVSMAEFVRSGLIVLMGTMVLAAAVVVIFYG